MIKSTKKMASIVKLIPCLILHSTTRPKRFYSQKKPMKNGSTIGSGLTNMFKCIRMQSRHSEEKAFIKYKPQQKDKEKQRSQKGLSLDIASLKISSFKIMATEPIKCQSYLC